VLFWNFLAAGVSTLVALMFWPKEAGTPFGFDRADARRIIRYGGFTVGLGVSAGLLAGADLIILGAIYTPEVVGVYGGAKRIYGVVSALISTAGLLVIPYVSRLNAEGRADETRALFEKAAAYIAAGLAAAVVVGWLLADPFYRYVMPAGYAASAPLFIILLTAAPFEGLYNITASVLYAMGSAGISVVISALGVVILAVALPLSAYYGGMLGAAWSQVAVTALVGVVMTWQAGRIVGAGLVSALGRLVQCIRGVFLLMSGR
jgi:PST family polysaccharide transporter